MQKDREYFLDTLKGIGIMGVVIIHVIAQLLVDIRNNITYGPFANDALIFLSYISRYCVPIFIMVTGYLYWKKNVNAGLKSTVKRLLPVILLYLIWSMVYALPINSLQNGQFSYFEIFVLGRSAPQMYYFPLIYIPVVIMLSCLKKIHYSPISLIAGIVVFGVIQVTGLLRNTFIPDMGFVFVYAFLGASFNYLENLNGGKKITLKVLLACALMYFVVNLVELIYKGGMLALEQHYTYYQIPILAFSISIFGLFYITKKSYKVLSYIGERSTVIYLQHWMFYIFIYGIWQRFAQDSGWLFYAQLSLIIVLVTYLPALFDSQIRKKPSSQ